MAYNIRRVQGYITLFTKPTLSRVAQIITKTGGRCMQSASQWFRQMFSTLRWEYKLGIVAFGCGAVLVCGAYAFSSFRAFLNPAASALQGSAYFAGINRSYCSYWALDHAEVGKPTASPCGVMMISVAISPSDAMPYTGNKYAFGNCTYWAAQRRAQIGKPIPNTWGDAYLWAGRARRDGFAVDHTPTPGAIMQTSGGGLGHVAFVESVDGDGTWHISEMNVIGLNQVDYRIMPARTAAYYNFIH